MVGIVAHLTYSAWAQAGETTPENWIRVKFTENNPQTQYKIYLKWNEGGQSKLWMPPEQPSKGYIPSSGEWIVPLSPNVWHVLLHVQYEKGSWHTLARGHVKTRQTYTFSSDGTYDDIAWYENIIRFRYNVPYDVIFYIDGHTRTKNRARSWTHSSTDEKRTDEYLLPPDIIKVTVHGKIESREGIKDIEYISDFSTTGGITYYLSGTSKYPKCERKSVDFRPANGKWIEVTHKGVYDAKFFVVWKENGQEQRWESGVKHGTLDGTTGLDWVDTQYRHLVKLPDDVDTVFLHAQARGLTGWKTIVASDVPVRRIYEVADTAISPTYKVHPPLPVRPANWIRIRHKGAYI